MTGLRVSDGTPRDDTRITYAGIYNEALLSGL